VFSSYAAWLILGMTTITFFGFRLGGYLIGRFLPRHGRSGYVLDRLPGLVLVSLLAPTLWELGWIGATSGLIVGLITILTGRSLLAMLLGMCAVALSRYLGLV